MSVVRRSDSEPATGYWVRELWRYPVKSMRGEQLEVAEIAADGIGGDRLVHVQSQHSVVSARTRPALLGLSATLPDDGVAMVEGLPWWDSRVDQLVKAAAGPDARLVPFAGPERFDILPLLVASDGAIATFGRDRRRLRPNIVIGGVEGLAERSWEGCLLRIGEVLILLHSLRGRCIVTTYDPDTLDRDVGVLQDINRRFDGTLALNAAVLGGGEVRVGDRAEVVELGLQHRHLFEKAPPAG